MLSDFPLDLGSRGWPCSYFSSPFSMYTCNLVTGFKNKCCFSLGSIFSKLVSCQTVELYTGNQPCSWGLTLASVTEDPVSWISSMGMCDLKGYFAPCVTHTEFFSLTQSVILLQALFLCVGLILCFFSSLFYSVNLGLSQIQSHLCQPVRNNLCGYCCIS